MERPCPQREAICLTQVKSPIFWTISLQFCNILRVKLNSTRYSCKIHINTEEVESVLWPFLSCSLEQIMSNLHSHILLPFSHHRIWIFCRLYTCILYSRFYQCPSHGDSCLSVLFLLHTVAKFLTVLQLWVSHFLSLTSPTSHTRLPAPYIPVAVLDTNNGNIKLVIFTYMYRSSDVMQMY